MAMSIISNFRKPKKSVTLKMRIKPKTQTAVIEAVAKKNLEYLHSIRPNW